MCDHETLGEPGDWFMTTYFYLPQELSAAIISQWRKETMRSSLSVLKKSVIDADRAAKAKLMQKVF